jgi:hypothetical protein
LDAFIGQKAMLTSGLGLVSASKLTKITTPFPFTSTTQPRQFPISVVTHLIWQNGRKGSSKTTVP